MGQRFDRLKPAATVLVLLCVVTSACRYWAGPLPLGTRNGVRNATGAASQTWAEPIGLPGLPNLHKVSDGLYRGAQPTARGIPEFQKLAIATVVNLQTSDTDATLIDQSVLSYEHIPMTPWTVDEAGVVRFLEVAADPNALPVFVHCRHGADRTGLVCATYRVTVQGWSKDAAIAEMTAGGFGFYSGWQNIIRYIRDLDVKELRRRAGLTIE